MSRKIMTQILRLSEACDIKMWAMHVLSSRDVTVLVFLTLVWGLNWPVMKIGVTDFPPLTFRTLCMWLGTPVLALVLLGLRVPFRVPRAHWPELLVLAGFNMLFWHALMIMAVGALSSGRSAILGYTMPIFSALFGAVFFTNRMSARAWAGVGCAALGVFLLLWHELTQLSGKPMAVLLALGAASTWALGTQLLRRTRIPVPTLTLSFWMTALTCLAMTALAWVFEREDWTQAPPPRSQWAILYNALGVFVFAQAAWFYLARKLPPVASTLSVMMIPVLGVFSGALFLGEALHWQDWSAVGLMTLSIAAVLWPIAPSATQQR
jgi:drug/metabolite transporter (DMT)-like permease